MNALLGQVGVWLGFAAAVSGALLLSVSLVRRARGRATDPRLDGRLLAPLVVLGMGIAVAAMEHALVTHDFSIAFVADNNSRATPLLYSITGLWSALAGSILLWGLALSAFTGLLVWRYRASRDPVVAWATLVLFCVSAFFIGLMLGPANPFVHVVGQAPAQGAGPNALLQDNPLVAIHPPLLYLGFVGFTVPFAFAVGMLATGRVGERWQIETRRWTLAAWTLLSVGIVLGAWWSYQVLGWGGFWGWDPVENAALLPWLCGTAYLHSVLVQERRGLLRVWNLSLSVATFALTILATFLTRSGVIQSVHAFSESTLGPLLIGFFLLTVAVGFGLIAWRGDRLRAPGGIDAPLGREGAFLLNNLLFVGFAFVVLLGTLFPLLYQALKHQAVTVGAPYFNTVAVPVGLGLLVLMALAPALSWRKIDAGVLWHRVAVPAWAGVLVIVGCVAAGLRGVAPLLAFGLGTFAASSAVRSIALSVRAGRRAGQGTLASFRTRANGGMVVHLGVVVLAIGITAATSYTQRGELALSPGQTRTFDGHTLRFERLATVTSASRRATQALIQVDHGGVFRPAVTQFAGTNSQVVGTPAIDSGFTGDVYLTFDALGGSGGATGAQVITNLASGSIGLGVTVEPLIDWMWAGGLIIGVGGLLAVFPGRRRRATDPVSGRAGEAALGAGPADPPLEEASADEARPSVGAGTANR
ncbi:MAG TPA: cytochrome c-type biogenesis CcmF C-terminal domain-containing protein [Acidimicrobiales bacterium]|nr:cytochrome c-type biogenesis CcmF C-terminal domain-containing protein [Acidimicrobiales bacterium]